MEEKALFVSAQALGFRAGSDGTVYVRISGLGEKLQLAAGLDVVLMLRNDEALQTAETLRRTALAARG